MKVNITYCTVVSWVLGCRCEIDPCEEDPCVDVPYDVVFRNEKEKDGVCRSFEKWFGYGVYPSPLLVRLAPS